MLTATCHCGRLRLSIPEAPQSLTRCNCSICYRHGALWSYYERSELTFVESPQDRQEYIWGARNLRFVRCAHCGCLMYWAWVTPQPDSKMGVNMRNFEQVHLTSLAIIDIDGASAEVRS